jgi:PAS domain S-box-containing protein
VSPKKITNAATPHHRLRRYERYFKPMFGQAAVGVARVAPDGRFLVVTAPLRRMLGYSKNELLTKTCKEITHPDDRAAETALMKRMLAGEETSYRTEKRYLRSSGTPLWVTETSSAVCNRAGFVLYRVCLIQVNERKVAEEHFRAAVEAAASGMVMVNQKGKIVLANSKTEQLFGYSREELIGKPIELLLASPFEKNGETFLAEVASQVDSRAIRTKWDIYGRCKDAQFFPAEVGLNPVHTLKGTWILYSIMDTSERTGTDENVHHTTVKIPVARLDSIAGSDNHKPSAPDQSLAGGMTASPTT